MSNPWDDTIPPELKDMEETFEAILPEDTSRLTLPEGTYKVRCVDLQYGESKAGNPKFAFTFEAVEPFSNIPLYAHIPAEGEAARRLRRYFKALRPDKDFPVGSNRIRISDYVGRFASAAVRTRPAMGDYDASSEIKSIRAV